MPMDLKSRIMPVFEVHMSGRGLPGTEETQLILKLMESLTLFRTAKRVSDRDLLFGRARAFTEALEIHTTIAADEWLRQTESLFK